MGKSQETYSKKEREKKRKKKRQEKLQRREERKANSKSGDLDDMIAYVDEYGNITDTPPDPKRKKVLDAETIELGSSNRLTEADLAPRTGKVEFFNDEKGFGFIKENVTNEKYFVHINGLLDEIIENDSVTFELERGLKGMNAVRVKKV